MIRPAKPDATLGVTRTEAYTDGVFAIAATLLVLDLTASAIGEVRTDAQMWQALGGLWENVLSFIISFVLLSGLWIIHLRQFRDIVRVDIVLLWLNSIRLLFIVLMPFTTILTAEYSAFYAGRMLLPINFFLAALAGHLSWRWAASGDGHLMRDSLSTEQREEAADGVSAVICAGVAAGLSPWIGSFGFLAFLGNGMLTRALRSRVRRRAGEASGTPG
ncbi:TMEM175 family protein [Microbacterium sp. GXF7504]